MNEKIEQSKTPEEKDNLKLEESRFRFSEETSKFLKESKSQLKWWREQEPGVLGMSFYGSRTVKKDKEQSDLDVVVFYDDTKIKIEGGTSDIAERTEFQFMELNFDYTQDPLPYQLNRIINLSQKSIIENLDEFSKLLSPDGTYEIKGENIESDLVWKVVSPFFLAIGEELYKARAEILAQLEKRENGEKIWQGIVKLLSWIERDGNTEKRGPLPAYNSYPQTIEDAKRFFHLK